MKEMTIKKKIYIASDGTKFDEKEKCASYEDHLSKEQDYERAKEELEKLRMEYPPQTPFLILFHCYSLLKTMEI